ncbi:hypothetical protein, partial [Parolsenella catena]|uniref:hypothetical protein n=1 Tax=Parolsenella catena TaxID=2003188 RepID=UPI003AF1DE26
MPATAPSRAGAAPEAAPAIAEAAPFDPAARQQGVDIGLAAGEPHGRNIGFQQAVFGFETLERKIGQFGGQDF